MSLVDQVSADLKTAMLARDVARTSALRMIRAAFIELQKDGKGEVTEERSQDALRRLKKIGNAHIFEAAISRNAAQRRLIDELLSFFGGRPQPVVAHLVETGKLTLDDVQEAEQLIRKLSKKEKPR